MPRRYSISYSSVTEFKEGVHHLFNFEKKQYQYQAKPHLTCKGVAEEHCRKFGEIHLGEEESLKLTEEITDFSNKDGFKK